jgi:hypothetical protein
MGILWQVSDCHGGVDVMLRLLSEEPSNTIRWFIAALLTNERDAGDAEEDLGAGADDSRRRRLCPRDDDRRRRRCR